MTISRITTHFPISTFNDRKVLSLGAQFLLALWFLTDLQLSTSQTRIRKALILFAQRALSKVLISKAHRLQPSTPHRCAMHGPLTPNVPRMQKILLGIIPSQTPDSTNRMRPSRAVSKHTRLTKYTVHAPPQAPCIIRPPLRLATPITVACQGMVCNVPRTEYHGASGLHIPAPAVSREGSILRWTVGLHGSLT